MENKCNSLLLKINNITRLFGHKMRTYANSVKLTQAMAFTLFVLDNEGALTQVEISNRVHMRASSISVAINKMVEDGLIELKTKNNDLRCTLVFITKKGQDLCNMIYDYINNLEKEIITKLNKQEVSYTFNTLCKIEDELKEGNINVNI